MALLGAEYASSDEDAPSSTVKASHPVAAAAVVAAPDVSLDVWSYHMLRNAPLLTSSRTRCAFK